MKNIPELENMIRNISTLKDESGVYFLFDGRELVYIGKTTKGLKRIVQHKDKKFDGYYFFEVDQNLLSETEKSLISKYKPKYNILIPGQKLIKRESKNTDLERVQLKPYRFHKTENIDFSAYVDRNLISNSKDLYAMITLQWMEFFALQQNRGVLYSDEIYFPLDIGLMKEELPFVFSKQSKRFPKIKKILTDKKAVTFKLHKNVLYFNISEKYRVLNKRIRIES